MVLVGVAALSAPAHAQPGAADVTASTEEPAPPPDDEPGPRKKSIDLGAFVGVHAFGDDIELGNSWASEQVPGTAVVLGGRAGITFLPDLAPSSSLDPQLGAEAELAFALASTGESMDGGRRSYFAPVFGWRAHAIARLRTAGSVHPFLVVGGGGETVVSGSPFMGDDTDAAFHWGGGLSWRAAPAWVARLDLRHGLTAGRVDDVVSTFEMHLGVEKSFDFGGGEVEQLPPIEDTDGDGILDPDDQCVNDPETVNAFQDDDGCPDTLDQDGDGILDPDDQCVNEPETVNQIDDADGCPEVDQDGDGLLGSKDGCPTEAEDVDQFEDEDGCPDLDDDKDGIPDLVDACRLETETFNGFNDNDGCPDEVPPAVKKFTGTIEGITFGYSRASITKPSKKVLNVAATVLREYPDVRVRIEGHTDPKGIYEKNVSLSLRRAEAVKWYLVDQGIAEDRIETVGFGPDKPRADNKTKKGRAKNRRIEFHLIVVGAPDLTAPAPAAPPQPEPQPQPQPQPQPEPKPESAPQ
jgi:OOP family OmpA-OmpF porin